MDINTLRQLIAERDTISVLETVDVHTGIRPVLKEFDYVIDADGKTKNDHFRDMLIAAIADKRPETQTVVRLVVCFG